MLKIYYNITFYHSLPKTALPGPEFSSGPGGMLLQSEFYGVFSLAAWSKRLWVKLDPLDLRGTAQMRAL